MTQSWSKRNNRLVISGLFWAGECALGLGLGALLVVEAGVMPGWLFALAMATAVALAAIGLRLSVYCLRQLGDPTPTLVIGPEGLFDRRLSNQTIPWAEVVRLEVYHSRTTQVMFDLSPVGDALIHPFERALARLARCVLLPGYSVVLIGTDADVKDVVVAMRRHAVAARPTGADPA